MPNSTQISDLLRATIEASGLTYVELERQTGVVRASIRRFVTRERTLRLDNADTLAAFFGLVLRKRRGR